jgi:hypothetical protein
VCIDKLALAASCVSGSTTQCVRFLMAPYQPQSRHYSGEPEPTRRWGPPTSEPREKPAHVLPCEKIGKSVPFHLVRRNVGVLFVIAPPTPEAVAALPRAGNPALPRLPTRVARGYTNRLPAGRFPL